MLVFKKGIAKYGTLFFDGKDYLEFIFTNKLEEINRFLMKFRNIRIIKINKRIPNREDNFEFECYFFHKGKKSKAEQEEWEKWEEKIFIVLEQINNKGMDNEPKH